MLRNSNRNIKILGAAWLGFGGIFVALAFIAFVSVVIGDDPETAAFEAGDKWWIVVLVLLGLGAVFSVNGLGLRRRHPVARPVLVISSLVLLIPSTLSVVTGAGVILLLVVVSSLWLTLSRGGKKAYESYMAREDG